MSGISRSTALRSAVEGFKSLIPIKISKGDLILSVVKMTSDVSPPHARRDLSLSFPRFGNSRNVETL
jgi:hypothetical protein